MKEFLRLLADERIAVEDLASHTFPIEDAESAYELVFNPQGLIHGITLSYPSKKKLRPILSLPPKEKVSEEDGKKTKSAGLIGLGAFMRSEILPHLKLCDGMRVHAIADSKGLQAKSTGKKLGAEYVTSDYHELINDKNVDLIICATRNSSHAAIAIDTLKANKHCYIEKPLAINEEELDAVMKVAQKSKGKLFVGFNRRFSHHFLHAKETFEDSATPLQILYRINYALEEHWSHDVKEGGRLITEGCHFVDALNYLTGSKPVRVSANIIPARGAIRHEEHYSFTVQYEDGSLGTVFYSGLGNFRLSKEYIEIYGDEKIFVIDNFKNGKIIRTDKTHKIDMRRQHKGYLEELEALRDAIREGSPSPISLQELYDTHRTTLAVAEALKTGGVVDLG